MRKLIVASLAAAILGGAALPAAARTNFDVIVNFGPPPLRYEHVPAPRVGLTWVPGYWGWRYERHHWVAGHWIHGRAGHVYAPARWVEHGGRWHYSRPHWHS